LIKLELNDGLEINTDDDKIQLPIIKSFLIDDLGFKQETQTLFRLSGEISISIIERVSLFLTQYFPDLEIGTSCQNRLQQVEQRRQNFVETQNKALSLKALIEQGPDSIPELTIPRLKDGSELKWYQKLGVLHALCIGNSANFSVPGSGKTWMGYSTFFKMKDEQKIVNKLLIIGPKVAFRPWEREYEIMTGNEPSIEKIAGSQRHREQVFRDDDAEIYFINYAMISRETENLIRLLSKEGNNFLVIADESHHFKNINSERARAISQITPHCTRKMILTGTMMPKELHDVYSQFNFLLSNEGILPNFDRFRTLYPNNNPDAVRTVSELVNPFFFRVNKSRLNLPPQTFNPPEVVEMYPIQRRIYNVVANVARRLDEQYRNDLVALNEWRRRAMVFLIEAATDPSLLPTNNQFTRSITNVKEVRLDKLLENYEGIAEENPPRKLSRAIELAKETLKKHEKVIIWCSFIKTINKLEKLFSNESIQTRIVYGAIPQDDDEDAEDNRVKRLDEFRDDDNINVLIANPASLAESVSLHRECHHAIYLDRTFNGGHYMQSIERIHRVGLEQGIQTKYDIIQSELSIDQIIQDRLERKVNDMNRFLENADLATMRFQNDNPTDNFKNLVGEDAELNNDFQAVLDHINRDVPDI